MLSVKRLRAWQWQAGLIVLGRRLVYRRGVEGRACGCAEVGKRAAGRKMNLFPVIPSSLLRAVLAPDEKLCPLTARARPRVTLFYQLETLTASPPLAPPPPIPSLAQHWRRARKRSSMQGGLPWTGSPRTLHNLICNSAVHLPRRRQLTPLRARSLKALPNRERRRRLLLADGPFAGGNQRLVGQVGLLAFVVLGGGGGKGARSVRTRARSLGGGGGHTLRNSVTPRRRFEVRPAYGRTGLRSG